MIPLEPCPFCGEQAKVFCIGWTTYCQCQNRKCAAMVSVQGKDDIQGAMQRWNRRNGQ